MQERANLAAHTKTEENKVEGEISPRSEEFWGEFPL